MVYIHSWQEFQDAAEALYDRAPNTARYCVKWKSSEGKLVLKITDNTNCIKFKTYSSIFLNRFEALNLSLMQKMQNRRPETPAPLAAPTLDPVRAATPVPGSLSAAISASPAAASGGVKKKKKPKKK
ncbi:hypothetical protein H0H81_009606 [Sphagnurus paluster]|uniref:SRP9 domain-containing protein n=1 Tax=Sphagnurus paluster TaxID=117069 RepID=A0A9P7K7F8_9AGAR|nr:hypothetical protein H0H81_009606 [Sphagnurus paluster]